jgi:hypothetical protein
METLLIFERYLEYHTRSVTKGGPGRVLKMVNGTQSK